MAVSKYFKRKGPAIVLEELGKINTPDACDKNRTVAGDPQSCASPRRLNCLQASISAARLRGQVSPARRPVGSK